MTISAQLKHNILTHIRKENHNHTYEYIATLHGTSVSKRTIIRWFSQWDGTVSSLERKSGSGRPRILTQREVTQHIQTPIRKLNRKAQRVTYTNITQRVREQTKKDISVRTVRRIGKTELHAKMKRGVKRTSNESE